MKLNHVQKLRKNGQITGKVLIKMVMKMEQQLHGLQVPLLVD
jgi:hypothetical protein